MMKGTGKAWRATVALAIVGAIGFVAIFCRTDADGTQGQTKYKVTFDVDNGSAVPEQSVDVGKPATKPANPTRTGFTFDDWYKTKDYKTKYDFATAVNGNITLYAKWNPVAGDDEWTVIFVYNDGATANKPIQVKKGQKVTEPEKPTRNGYAFDAWYGNEALTAKYDFNSEVNGNISVYTKWIPLPKYAVTVNEGGTGVTATPGPASEGTTVTLTP